MTLDRWLHIATGGLVEEAQRRVEAEVRAHVAALMEAEGLSEEDAVARQGSVWRARWRFGRKYLRKAEAKRMMWFVSPPKFHLWAIVLGLPALNLLNIPLKHGFDLLSFYYACLVGLLAAGLSVWYTHRLKSILLEANSDLGAMGILLGNMAILTLLRIPIALLIVFLALLRFDQSWVFFQFYFCVVAFIAIAPISIPRDLHMIWKLSRNPADALSVIQRVQRTWF